MRRSILVALGAGAVISSAAAIGIGAAVNSAPQTMSQHEYERTQQSSRTAQRARIEARYQVERARCGALGGFKRDKCLVSAHAARGRSKLESAVPYEVRF